MKKMLVLVALALAVAPAASAKELLGLQLCGASGCATDKNVSAAFEGPGGPFTTGAPVAAPAAPGPWYRLYGLLGDRGKVFGKLPLYYVPGAHVIVTPGQGGQTTTWQRTSAQWRAVLDRLATRVKPFATPTLSRVSLNGDAALDPQSYLALYTLGTKATTYPRDVDSVQIVLESERRTPWTDGNYVVLYPKSNLLVRDGQLVAIPRDVSARAADGRSLDVGRSFPWVPVLAGLAAVALALAGAWLVRRAAARPQPVAQA